VAHACTDFLSFVTIALLPLLAVRLDMSITQKASLISLGAVASGAIQPVVAWLSDRFDSRVTGTLGLAVASVCVGLLGYAQGFDELVVLFFFAVLGIGAFHPASAAAVGQLAGTRRSAMLSVFFLFGMIGGILGNVLSPAYVHAAGELSGETGDAAVSAGLKALIWFTPAGLLAAGALAWAIHKAPHRRGDADTHHRNLGESERSLRWRAVWLLYICNIIRFTVNQMLVYLLIEWVERVTRRQAGVAALDVELGQRASELNGPMQASMQVGMGAGALALGFFLTGRHEKKAFVIIPLIGAVAIAAIPHTDALLEHGRWAVIAPAALLAIVAGFGFGSLVPVSLSLGQRLLPHRTSLASGMLLGGAWCVAFIGPQISRLIHAGEDANLEPAFLVAAGTIGLASLLSLALPDRLLREVSPH
jgi:MFS family permease